MRPSLLLLLCLVAAPVWAQQPALPEAPVRYDTDLLPTAFHAERRARVLEALPPDGVAIFFGQPTRTRENDVDFEYRQDSYLYYLTGTHEAGSVLLLAPGGIAVDGGRVTELLLVPPRNPAAEVWTGRRFGAPRARAELGVEEVVTTDRFEEIVGALAADGRRFFHLPLPDGMGAGDELGAQLAFFRQTVPTLEVTGSGMARQAALFMLTLDSPEAFDRMKPLLTSRLEAGDFESPVLQEAYAAFASADTYAAWEAWRHAHLSRYADATLLKNTLDALRMVKTDGEMKLLRRAVDISVAAHNEVIRSIEPGMYEYQAEALAEYVFKRNGAEAPGYPSIVGAGENATILHYESNRRRMDAGDLVVMDMGAEYHGYSADVTRTVPVSGTFSAEQKAIYEIVLRAQQAGIEAAVAGASFGAPGQAATRVIADGLRQLGLARTDADVRGFFMHGTSHYIGLYVHDVGVGGVLVPGAVVTVEPGIYISPRADVDAKWWNIGVRIEDDILVTESGPVNLSAGAPRSVEAIEALMRERGLGNENAGLVSAAAGE